ncbi:Peptidase cysteine/serine, trypsin [Beauveria bassiana ARSEF 2860]|uniref:Peptidase cysteine/serine, trypsin n=1 Tax=Beauveria bassiana (strain ARSEF 2860) TaxID=655819 RepID=J5JEE8_BEAB2|nr:Peptidase cysteine/serine, trypsin [Beauveria bassiana ARSEF 2860]EJP62101.1 Peptidase cysteine/serine, trypsin [Beauveria bassiana ARSEF 2860]
MVSLQLHRLAFLACLMAFLTALPVTAIAGGQDAELGWFPYTVSLRNRGRHNCGGIIIDQSSILTAAHCIVGLSADRVSIVAGAVKLDSGGTTYQVSAIHKHPGYNSSTITNDIAVLKLAKPLSYTPYIRPIALATQDPPAGSGTLGSGWGVSRSSGPVSNTLQWISLQSLDHKICQEKMGVTVSQICTTSANKGGMCRGDSGGPLTDERITLVGVYSWGRGCGDGYPDVYASVAYHREWIRSYMG